MNTYGLIRTTLIETRDSHFMSHNDGRCPEDCTLDSLTDLDIKTLAGDLADALEAR